MIMKKKYVFKLVLLSISFMAFLLMSSSGGRDDGRTGSPGDGGNTCTACHGGGSFGASATIATNIPAGGYDVNTDYTITVVANSSANAHGFQLTAERLSDNAKVGTFTAGAGSRVTGQRITHSTPLQGSNTWTFTWTSPATLQGNIKFYAAVNAVNLNGSTSGDQVVTTSTGSLNALGISEAKRLNFIMYPNPSSSILTIQLPDGDNTAEVIFYNTLGKEVYSTKIRSENNIDVSRLPSGVYLLKVKTASKIGVQQFVKK